MRSNAYRALLVSVVVVILAATPLIGQEKRVALVPASSADMVLVQGGTFTMGSPNSEQGRSVDEVQHQVTVSSFHMAKYDVTQDLYQSVMGNNPSQFPGDVWYSGNSGSTTHPVGQKTPNALGLYDMSGNVWQWCWDWYGDYSGSGRNDPRGASSGADRVRRGGSWGDDARDDRVAYRGYITPAFPNSYLGFRLVRS